jgi:predicted Zn-dependent protease
MHLTARTEITNTMTRNQILLCIFFSPLFLNACSRSPTGRKQLALVPEGQLEQMGVQAFTELKSKEKISTDASSSAYVKCVADRVTSVLGEKRAWEVVFFDKDEVNAFALPGGKIGVYSGLLKAAKNQHQLAAVLGHEVAHVTARHGQERVSEQLAAQGGLQALALILGNKQDSRRGLLLSALGLGAQFGVLLPHSRDQESEADIVGLDSMAKAGFDPRQSVELWKNMASVGGAGPPEFLSTHPSHETRIKNLQERIPKAMPLYEGVGSKPQCEANR